MDINIRVLGSTSFGNSTLIWDKSDSILIDCGFSVKYTRQNLEILDMDFSSLSGVFLTHLHTDHIKLAMANRLYKERIPVFCHHDLYKDLIYNYESLKKARKENLLRTYKNEGINLGSFIINGFEVPHDSKGGCYGYNIYKKANSETKKITIATDLGFPKDHHIEHFINSDAIIIESNHDIQMLDNSKRPIWLKQRIKKAHLSNDICAKFLSKVIEMSEKKPKAIILAHISQECNTNGLAKDCTRKKLINKNYDDICVIMTHKMKPNKIVKI